MAVQERKEDRVNTTDGCSSVQQGGVIEEEAGTDEKMMPGESSWLLAEIEIFLFGDGRVTDVRGSRARSPDARGSLTNH